MKDDLRYSQRLRTWDPVLSYFYYEATLKKNVVSGPAAG